MLRHSVVIKILPFPHFLLNSGGVACRVTELSEAVCLVTLLGIVTTISRSQSKAVPLRHEELNIDHIK